MKPSAKYSILLITVQGLCAAVFVSDAISDIAYRSEHDWHLLVEIIASIALMLAIILETGNLFGILQRKANLERTLKNASMAVHLVIDSKFSDWSFSPSERDVAGLVVKGLSIAEIAKVRGTAEGTVKAQLNSIYRKSGARNRSDLMSQILDAMIDRPLLDEAAADVSLPQALAP